jgi:predicted nucleic acid-binding protein
MAFVIDASVAACWLMPDEMHAVADAARRRMLSDAAIVPAIWWFEIRNVLIVGERRGRLDAALTARAVALLSELPVSVDHDPDESAILSLCRHHRLSVYDAAYLSLAIREKLVLATLDDALARAAAAEGVILLDTSFK